MVHVFHQDLPQSYRPVFSQEVLVYMGGPTWNSNYLPRTRRQANGLPAVIERLPAILLQFLQTSSCITPGMVACDTWLSSKVPNSLSIYEPITKCAHPPKPQVKQIP